MLNSILGWTLSVNEAQYIRVSNQTADMHAVLLTLEANKSLRFYT